MKTELKHLEDALVDHLINRPGEPFGYVGADGQRFDFPESCGIVDINRYITMYDKRLAEIDELIADRPEGITETEQLILSLADMYLQQEKHVAEGSKALLCRALDRVYGVGGDTDGDE